MMEKDKFESIKARIEAGFSDEAFQSEKIQRFLESLIIQKEISEKRWEKVNTYLVSLGQDGIDSLISKECQKHDENWKDKWYSKGIEPIESNLLDLLFCTAAKYGEEVDESEIDKNLGYFSSLCYKYLGHYFVTIHGQGVVREVYNREKEIIF